MSVVDVTQMWSQNGGTINSPKSDATDLTFSLTEAYLVAVTNGTTRAEVEAASGVPINGQQYADGRAAFVTSRSFTQLSPILWQVNVGYEGESADPESVEVEWSDTTSTEPIDRDYNGDAIVTENGEQVDGLTMEISDQIAVITKKFLTIDLYAVGLYRHATNSDTFLGWPAGTARLVGFSAKNRFKYGQAQEQWTVQARIQFRRGLAGATDAQAWYKRWRHEGFYVRSVAAGAIYRARDSNGLETTKPVLLDVNGVQETDPAAAVFIYTQVYGSLPYSGLGLL